jgi:hypothetical protein
MYLEAKKHIKSLESTFVYPIKFKDPFEEMLTH